MATVGSTIGTRTRDSNRPSTAPLFQNTMLPLLAKPTNVNSEVPSKSPQIHGQPKSPAVASRINNLPTNPDNGGMPITAITTTKNIDPINPACANVGEVVKASPNPSRRTTTASMTKKSAAIASVECTM